eukprot:Pgem_evm1s1224
MLLTANLICAFPGKEITLTDLATKTTYKTYALIYQKNSTITNKNPKTEALFFSEGKNSGGMTCTFVLKGRVELPFTTYVDENATLANLFEEVYICVERTGNVKLNTLSTFAIQIESANKLTYVASELFVGEHIWHSSNTINEVKKIAVNGNLTHNVPIQGLLHSTWCHFDDSQVGFGFVTKYNNQDNRCIGVNVLGIKMNSFKVCKSAKECPDFPENIRFVKSIAYPQRYLYEKNTPITKTPTSSPN